MNPLIRTRIEAALHEAGMAPATYQTYQTQGLPLGVPVAPQERRQCDLETILITATHVQRFGLNCPFNFSRWRDLGPARPYASPPEMIAAVRAERDIQTGCWA